MIRLCLSLGVCVVAVLVSALGLLAWHNRPADNSAPPEAAREKPVAGESVHVQFRNVASSAGVSFRHVDGRTDMHYVPEIMGGGAAWIDYDQDGLVDLFFVQGGKFPPDMRDTGRSGDPARLSRMYRNLGRGRFEDVTDKVGIRHPDFGQGVAVGDYDNDGFPDLFVSCYGHCHLYHNEPDPAGGRRFREATKEAGVDLDGWCTSCAFGDVHGNGLLDLFVCRYTTMDLTNYPFCGEKSREPPLRYSCGPREFRGSSSVLFRNNGDGTFTNVSKQAGVDQEGKGLGVLILDFDGDGKMDIFVGNDEMPNHHFRNLGGGKFQECGVLSGTAANYMGKPMGSMGLESGDMTGNGRPDIFITTYYHEGTTLLRNNGGGLFLDVSQQAGMYAASWNRVGWGTGLFDVDRDGALDLFVANGHVYRNAADIRDKFEDGEAHTYEQPAQLFLGNGKGSFREVSKDAGAYFAEAHVGRGVALGDFDNDGFVDIAINNCGEPAALLHNETKTPHHWIRLQLEGSRHTNPQGSNRDAVGAVVTVKAGGRTFVRHVKGGGSYYSAHDRRLLVGLGAAQRVDEIDVRWPNAKAATERFGPLAADAGYKLVEGSGAAVPVRDGSRPELSLTSGR